MKRPIYITCTHPRAEEIALSLSNVCNAIPMPALNVNVIASVKPQGNFDVMLVSSMQALLCDDLPHNLPVIAVGDVTASALIAKGFDVTQAGTGGVQDLDLSIYQSILYPCATESSFVPDNATAWPIYETTPNPDFDITDDEAVICLFSAKAAQHYAEKCYKETHDIICFSQTIADRIFIHKNPGRLAVCKRPSYDAMKDLILEILKDAA